MLFQRIRSIVIPGASIIGGLLLAALAVACPIYWPNRMLVDSEKELLVPPEASFREELEEICRTVTPPEWLKESLRSDVPLEPGGNYARQAEDADLTELRLALEHAYPPIPSPTREAAFEDYRAIRSLITRCRESGNIGFRSHRSIQDASRDSLSAATLSPIIPAEFAAYLRGTISYHLGDYVAARSEWMTILQMNESAELHRGVWASYMIGKTWMLEEELDLAIQFFRKAQELAVRKFCWAGPGLDASAHKWEAICEIYKRNFQKGMRMLLEQLAAGREWAKNRLDRAVFALLDSGSPEELAVAARDPLIQKVVTAWFISLRYQSMPKSKWRYLENLEASMGYLGKWLKTLESATKGVVPNADRIALAAYQGGQMDAAARWALLADADSTLTIWVRAKLLLRQGDTETAKHMLARIAPQPRQEKIWKDWNTFENDWWFKMRDSDRVYGELAVLLLDSGDHLGALDAFLKGRYWLDAAYVAERVLTVQELQSYVEAEWAGSEDETAKRIRCLLGRRLAREDHWIGTLDYFPASIQPTLRQFLNFIRISENPNNTQLRRGEALFEAARILSASGMEILGYEGEPDWFAYQGRYTGEVVTSVVRVGELIPDDDSFYSIPIRPWLENSGLDPRTYFDSIHREEVRRVLQHTPRPNLRFHYRYYAASLAWKAAELLPDDHEQTARALWEGGCWVKARNPPFADHFYKALVRRNPNIPLAQEADRIRWFPKVDQNGEPILRSAGGETGGTGEPLAP